MSGPPRRFDPSEVRVPGEADPSPAEQADALAAARELESLVAGAVVRPTDGFEDRVMAVIATEPAPRLVVRPAGAVRGGLVASFLMAVRDSWGVATTGGRSMAVRAQALAFVLLVVVATGALASVGAMGVGGLFDRGQSPAPSVDTAPTVAPTSTDHAAPTVVPTPTESAEPSKTPEATETAEPAETEDANTPRPARTHDTETSEPHETEDSDHSSDETDDHSGRTGGSDDG